MYRSSKVSSGSFIFLFLHAMKRAVSLFCLFLILFALSCAVNPVTGKKELSLISEGQEISLGAETDKEIRVQYGIYHDPSLEKYVRRVGEELVPHTHRPHLTYHFSVLDTPVVNAFAVPGGYVYVTRGILVLMNSEAELAAVLGHELGHINARHSVRRMSKLILVQLGLSVGGALSETFAKISGVASLSIQLLFLKYSRDDEREADRLGVEYSRKSGFNPGKMVDFFASLQRLGDLSKGASLPGFLSTHPLNQERIQNAKGMLTADDQSLLVRDHSYLSQIDNIVFGDDPRQGFVEKSTFYHPQLRFFFSIPEEWELRNTPSQVVMSSKDGNAAVVLQAEKSSESPADYAQKKATSIQERQFIGEESLTVNSLPAHQILLDIAQEEKEDLRIGLTCIKKGDYIFSFTTLSTLFDYRKFEPSFQSIIQSFDELRDEVRLNRKPKRLKLIRASGKESLRQIFEKAGMEKEQWPKTAILNGMQIDENPKPNQLVKIIK